MRNSLDANHRGSKACLPFFTAKGLAVLFRVCFGRICIPIYLNGVLKQEPTGMHIAYNLVN